MNPRVVIITRPTAYQNLLAQHGTLNNAEFFLNERAQQMEPVMELHARQQRAVESVTKAIPVDWRNTAIDRADLDRFLFEPEDIVCVVGQDGLVANVSKYLDGQPVLGFNPDHTEYEGVLVALEPQWAPEIFPDIANDTYQADELTMVSAKLDDGQELVCLNEIFLGHPTHQSARYRIEHLGGSERQSSSGVIVATGTGATGWARSVHQAHHSQLRMPDPTRARLIYYVREAFPAPMYGTVMTEGEIDSQPLALISENEQGTIFGDGIEADHLEWGFGKRVEVGIADRRLRLVVG